MALTQARDFRDECDALHAVLAVAPRAAWRQPTQFKQWTFDDIVGHLYFFDRAAAIAARSREDVQALFGELATAARAGVSMIDYSRRWLAGCSGTDLLARWREQYLQLAALYADLDPNLRLAWAGPDMSARSFMSARQMEAWAHGQAVFDALDLERAEHDRIRNIAVMGINTFGWTFAVNRLEVPGLKPYVRLVSPSGAAWEWHDASATERVEGTAVDFCRVVTQTRNVRDTALQVTGPVAQQWLDIAQCFAGARETPPPPGARYRQIWDALSALDPVPVTELGKADTRSVTGTGSSVLAASRAGTSPASDAVPSPERVSAFPSSGDGTASDAPASDRPRS